MDAGRGRVIFTGWGRTGQDEKTAGRYKAGWGRGLKLWTAAKVERFHGSGQGGVRMAFYGVGWRSNEHVFSMGRSGA